jgi:hypothetical protein
VAIVWRLLDSVGHEPRGYLEAAGIMRGVGSNCLGFGKLKPARDKLGKDISPGNWLDCCGVDGEFGFLCICSNPVVRRPGLRNGPAGEQTSQLRVWVDPFANRPHGNNQS